MCLSSSPRSAACANLPVVRVIPGQVLRVTICSAEGLWIGTHWRQRSLPCPGEGCALCGILPGRELGYWVVTLDESNPRPLLLELPRGFGVQMGLFVKHSGQKTSTGCQLLLTRKKKRSPIHADYDGHVDNVPEAWRAGGLLRSAVATLFRLPQPVAGHDVAEWTEACRRSAAAQCFEAAQAVERDGEA